MKPAMIYGIIAVVAIILVILVARYYKNEEFTPVYSQNDTEIVENYPTAPQNVLVSDANGNLSVTNDLGLQHLNVVGNAQVGNLYVTGAVRLSGDVTAANRNILAELDALKASIAAVNTRVDTSNTRIETVNTATNTRIDTVNNTAVFYDTAVKTLADNGIMNGGTYGAAGNFMPFGNCDQCGGGNDKFKLWPNSNATTSFKFVKKYP
jgi:hypothetical protein